MLINLKPQLAGKMMLPKLLGYLKQSRLYIKAKFYNLEITLNFKLFSDKLIPIILKNSKFK